MPQSNYSIGKKVCEVYDTNSLVKKSLILKFIASAEVCNMARCSCPHPHEKDVSILKSIFFAHYVYVYGLVEFGVVWGVSMDRTTVMLTDQIRKRVCLAV